jgi:hypothetical protein
MRAWAGRPMRVWPGRPMRVRRGPASPRPIRPPRYPQSCAAQSRRCPRPSGSPHLPRLSQTHGAAQSHQGRAGRRRPLRLGRLRPAGRLPRDPRRHRGPRAATQPARNQHPGKTPQTASRLHHNRHRLKAPQTATQLAHNRRRREAPPTTARLHRSRRPRRRARRRPRAADQRPRGPRTREGTFPPRRVRPPSPGRRPSAFNSGRWCT